MGKLPAFQFYPGDWRKSPDVQACSFAARGLWVEMLCLMWEMPRRGHLQLPNGVALSVEQLARMVGGTATEIDPLLAELEAAGVFSRTVAGVIYCRRMDRDEHIRAVRSEAGKKGAGFGHLGGRPRKSPENPLGGANAAFAVSSNPMNPGPENGKKGKPEGKITPSSSSSSNTPLPPRGGVPVVDATTGERGGKQPRTKKPRERNPLFDAVADVTGCDPATAGGLIGKTAAALASATPPYTPADIHEFGRRFWQLCPWAQGERDRPTPNELANHIGRLRAAPVHAGGEAGRIKTAADNPLLSWRGDAGGDR